MKAVAQKRTSGWNDLEIEQLFGLWNWEKILKLATALGLGWKQMNLIDNINIWLKFQIIQAILYNL